MSMSKQAEDSLSDSDGSDGWNDVNEGDDDLETPDIVSLFDANVFRDAASMLAHCKENFHFDFVATRDRLRLDFVGSIKLVNYIRSTVKARKTLPAQISAADIADERFMLPVLPDDALIMCLDDLPAAADAEGEPGAADATAREAALQAQLEDVTRQFANYRLAVEQTLDKRWHADDGDDSSSTSSKAETKEKEEDSSQSYWEGYAGHDIHETMLRDAVRTAAYRDFIYGNAHLFAGKTVLDLGCGTGILAMFCARAGAAHVYAVDNAAILDRAREHVARNGLAARVTCLRGRAEDVALPVAAVDVIVSEWMGYCLLYEAMLPSVLAARDRWLAPGGLMVPSHATLFVAPLSGAAGAAAFWRDVYGFDMRPMLAGALRDVRVQRVPAAAVCGAPCAVAPLDLYTCRAEDLRFRARWCSVLARDVGGGDGDGDGTGIDGFAVWFDTYFAATPPPPPRQRQRRRPGGRSGGGGGGGTGTGTGTGTGNGSAPAAEAAEAQAISLPAGAWAAARRDGSVAFTTAPGAAATHWKQGLLLVDVPEGGRLARGRAGAAIGGTVAFAAAAAAGADARGLEITMEWEGLPSVGKTQTWRLC